MARTATTPWHTSNGCPVLSKRPLKKLTRYSRFMASPPRYEYLLIQGTRGRLDLDQSDRAQRKMAARQRVTGRSGGAASATRAARQLRMTPRSRFRFRAPATQGNRVTIQRFERSDSPQARTSTRRTSEGHGGRIRRAMRGPRATDSATSRSSNNRATSAQTPGPNASWCARARSSMSRVSTRNPARVPACRATFPATSAPTTAAAASANTAVSTGHVEWIKSAVRQPHRPPLVVRGSPSSSVTISCARSRASAVHPIAPRATPSDVLGSRSCDNAEVAASFEEAVAATAAGHQSGHRGRGGTVALHHSPRCYRCAPAGLPAMLRARIGPFPQGLSGLMSRFARLVSKRSVATALALLLACPTRVITAGTPSIVPRSHGPACRKMISNAWKPQPRGYTRADDRHR